VEQIKIHTRQYAKRQMTWLRRDNSYTWIMPDEMMTLL
jgi:tRNA dimethylallyltransferase